eukprot:XP_011676442.1 PREDICTED: fibropellin-3 [Strongylocentrotus purpuratus]
MAIKQFRITGDQTLRGLLMQARLVGSPAAVGTWSDFPDTFQTNNFLATGDSVTHTESSDKNPSDLTFMWQAPSAGVGDIQFVGTFVQERRIFWVQVKSRTLTQRATGPCSSSPCQNGGLCFMSGDNTDYTCACPTGFSGMNCELSALTAVTAAPTATGPCISSPCQNGGLCFMSGDDTDYTCACPPGFSGMNCDLSALTAVTAARTATGPCISSPCQNGGLCFMSGDDTDYACVCPTGFSGMNCELSALTEVTAAPTATGPCISSPCQNGGMCFMSSDDTDYTCLCPVEFSGMNCELSTSTTAAPTVMNPCMSEPCQNGGQCFAQSDNTAYRCICPGNFFGTNCEAVLTVQQTTVAPRKSKLLDRKEIRQS